MYDDDDHYKQPKWERPEIDEWDYSREITTIIACMPTSNPCWPRQNCWPHKHCWPRQGCWPAQNCWPHQGCWPLQNCWPRQGCWPNQNCWPRQHHCRPNR